jgi:hypothetical protein
MKSLFFLVSLTFFCSSCSAEVSKAIPMGDKPPAYESCYPLEHYRPPFEVASTVSAVDKQTYWEVKAISKNLPANADSFVYFHFKTNSFGKCQVINQDQTSSRLNYMPEDAAIDLARQHYEPAFRKFMQECTAKKEKRTCISEFTALIDEEESSQEEQVILGLEDVKALKQLGIELKNPVRNYSKPKREELDKSNQP